MTKKAVSNPKEHDMKKYPIEQIHRRQLLAAAAVLGVAPWLLTASSEKAIAQPAGARRRLGPLEVFPIGLGCQWHPGRRPQDVNDLYSSGTDRQGAIALIRRAVDLGVTLFDTAEAYGPFMSEDIVGEGLQGVSYRVVV